MADESAHGVSHDLSSLLSSQDREFLIRSNGDQAKLSSLAGKIVGLYFSGSWCGPCRHFTPTLIEVYEELSSKFEFEVVFISSDRDEESFHAYFSKMPWLAIPYSDDQNRKRLKELFKVRGIPNFVIIDAEGKICCDQGVKFIRDYGADGYPFTAERVDYFRQQEEHAKINQTLNSILVSKSRDFLVSRDGTVVPVSELEGKLVGLYFAVNSHPSSLDFTPKLLEVYQKLKKKGENFEIVLISLDYDENNFKQCLETMPWPALPFHDKIRERLARYFELSVLPTLVIIGEDGKTLNQNVAELIADHGIVAYPFTQEKLVELAEIDKAKLEAQTLESVLVHGDKDFVIDKSGFQVPVVELVGKNIVLYFSAKWCPPCRAFLPKLIEAYHEIKSKDIAFEIIFISSDRDQSSFDEFYTEMPWLALPFGDERKPIVARKFKIKGIPAAIAISPTGKTVTKEAAEHITTHGADAYPFTDDHLKELNEKLEKVANEWPEKVKHELHPEHELVRIKRNAYGCNGCREMGLEVQKSTLEILLYVLLDLF
ncbi:probable nucleoredoxin 1 [Mercurialis annua]|uniref:probable nucleoredoxin 1 n=1 Tax=Mercurialis annua TaxID=3986 RepID=UPI00215E3A0B|nr:probable nucleoredoxin 1 [Mercurialis annua]